MWWRALVVVSFVFLLYDVWIVATRIIILCDILCGIISCSITLIDGLFSNSYSRKQIVLRDGNCSYGDIDAPDKVSYQFIAGPPGIFDRIPSLQVTAGLIIVNAANIEFLYDLLCRSLHFISVCCVLDNFFVWCIWCLWYYVFWFFVACLIIFLCEKLWHFTQEKYSDNGWLL